MHIAIIGAGLSGTALAIACSRYLPHTGRIHLYERASVFAQGLAYSTPCDRHLLNVPAGRMAVHAHEPEHLLAWLRAQGYQDPNGEALAHSYVPRKLYGRYLYDALQAATVACAGRLQCHPQNVVALHRNASGMQVHTASAPPLQVDHVVLCTGHMLPRAPRVPGSELLVAPSYIADPWDQTALARLGPKAHIALLGAGLTMVDVALRLTDATAQAPFTGTLTAVSRHGLLPQAHLQALSPIKAWPAPTGPTITRQLFAAVRARVRAHQASGGDWRQVVDSLRSQTPALWQSLGQQEQARLLRHGKAQWDAHRHRVAPAVSHALHALRRQGLLSVVGGRLMAVAPGAKAGSLRLTWRRRHEGTLWHHDVQGVVNCTGGHSDAREVGSPLWNQLRTDGMIRPGAHGMGVAMAADGRVVDASGQAAPALWTLGPLRVGLDFESVAVPELRDQAARLAHTLLAGV